MSDDVLSIVLSFLSAEEKIKIREVSKGFTNIVSQRTLNEYRLNWLMKNFVRRENRLEEELNIIARHINHKRVDHRVHPLYMRRRGVQCIADRCRNEQLGHIYIKDWQVDFTFDPDLYGNRWACSKRKISYCVHCFERWMVRCSMADLNLSSPRAL